MGYTNEAKSIMLSALRGDVAEISLHTNDPGTAGDNEVSGGGYSRASAPAADWGTPSEGSVSLSSDKEFSGPPSGTCSHFGLWDGSDTFLGGGTITGDTSFNAEGDFILKAGTSFDLNG